MLDINIFKFEINFITKMSDPLQIKHYTKPYNIYRRAKLMMLSAAFKQHQKFVDLSIEDRFALLEKIERSCFNYSIDKAKETDTPTKWENSDFQFIYTLVCARIGANIDQTNTVHNEYLANAILEGKISVTELPKMSSQELFPDKYKNVLTKLEMSKNVQRSAKTSTMYKCRRCHKNQCTIENRYNRSLDEGVNLTITCESCGLEWNA